MKGKLVKTRDGFYVLNDEYGNLIKHKLSIKNCQVVENGYDLDDKISKHLEKNDIEASTKRVQVIKELILEILFEKKFSEEDMRKMYDISCGKIGLSLAHDQTENNERFRSHLRSIQQTQWDVDIEMGGYKLNCDGEKYGFPDLDLPKLDENGCLILKKK